jgi:hypothetical protein
MCKKILHEITNFAEVEGPDMKTGKISKELRALCSSCFFRIRKKSSKSFKKKNRKTKARKRTDKRRT